MAIHPKEIKKPESFENKAADRITGFAGSMKFLYLNILWVGLWVVVNSGLLGQNLIFDPYPFGLLTMLVSLQAIFLAIFVLIKQTRQAKLSELRMELDYHSDLRSEKDIEILVQLLARLAEKQNVDTSDLRLQLRQTRQHITHELRKKHK